MKRTISVLLAILLLLSGVGAIGETSEESQFGSLFAGLKELEMGMDSAQVTALMGEPYETDTVSELTTTLVYDAVFGVEDAMIGFVFQEDKLCIIDYMCYGDEADCIALLSGLEKLLGEPGGDPLTVVLGMSDFDYTRQTNENFEEYAVDYIDSCSTIAAWQLENENVVLMQKGAMIELIVYSMGS